MAYGRDEGDKVIWLRYINHLYIFPPKWRFRS